MLRTPPAEPLATNRMGLTSLLIHPNLS
jgi:hypothetical protein